MGKIRVLEIIQTIGIGGAETVMLNTAIFLDKSQFDVRALVVGSGPLVDKLREHDIDVDTIKFDGRYNWGLLRCIWRLIRQHKIDIVHTHLSRMNTYGFVASLFTPATNIMTVHGVTEFSGFLGRLYYSTFGRVSGKVVTVSDKLADRFHSATRVSRKKIVAIPNGIDIERFEQPADRENTLRRFGIPLDAKIILAVGNIRRIKGYEFLVESFAQIAKEEPNLVLVICGRDYINYRCFIDSLIKESKLSKRIFFTDFVPDIEVLYSVADVYALTSITEGFSLTTVEAMASSKAVISTDCMGPSEIIDDGIDGIIIPERDPNRFGEALLGLIRDEERRKTLGQAARRKVENKYTIQKSVRAFEQLFISLVNH